jgi:urease accessory protein
MAILEMIRPDAPFDSDALRQQSLLAAWFSPGFPVGGFAFSHGLEWAHEAGAITGATALEAWCHDVLTLGSGRSDAIFLNAARRATREGDAQALGETVELASASQPSRERHMEASVQGRAFFDLARALYPAPAFAMLDGHARLTLPVVAGVAGAAHAIDGAALTCAYLSAFVANLCSAAVRLGAVGQTDGQRVVAALASSARALALDAQRLGLDDLGGCALRSDLASIQHEIQHARLFRS